MEETCILLLKELMAEIEWPWANHTRPIYWSSLEISAIVEHSVRVVSEMEVLSASFRRDMRSDLSRFDWETSRERCRRLGKWLDTAERTLRLRQKEAAAGLDLTPLPDRERLRFLSDELEEVVRLRWVEAQTCMHAQSHTAAIVMMGSVLEGLLTARIRFDDTARAAARAPKRRDGALVDPSRWKLAEMIDVALELGWLKPGRAKFGHEIRELRNTVHPWHDASIRIRVDQASCRTAWAALRACVDDLSAFEP